MSENEVNRIMQEIQEKGISTYTKYTFRAIHGEKSGRRLAVRVTGCCPERMFFALESLKVGLLRGDFDM